MPQKKITDPTIEQLIDDVVEIDLEDTSIPEQMKQDYLDRHKNDLNAKQISKIETNFSEAMKKFNYK